MYDATLMENVVLDDIENIKKKRRLSVQALYNSGFGERLETLPERTVYINYLGV